MCRSLLSWLLLAIFILPSALVTLGQPRGVKHLIIVGCDGLSPDGIRRANAPTFARLMNEGAWTFHARGVMPTVSSPNWASIIMGAGPEQHGVTSNDWQTNKFEIPPTLTGPEGMFPTIFGLLRQQRPKSTIACFHDWSGFGRLFERSAANIIEDTDGPTNTIRRAIEYLPHKPTFTFLHLDHVDHAGHHFGHGTPEYYQSVTVADQLIAKLLAALETANMAQRTILLITSDHGGKGKGHGGTSLEELEIPWILHGPGVKKSYEIKQPVNNFDTAPTAAYILGLKLHPAWIGKPITEAFK